MIKAKLAAKVAQLTSERVPFVLATVVRARRPASVRPGDTAVVHTDGTIEGFVGGQCAESSVRLYAMRALETGEALLLRLVPGVGEGEQVDDGIDGAIVEHNPCLSGGALEIFLEPQLPEPRIMIVGGSPVARALEQLSLVSAYQVQATLGAPETDLLGATAVVVASHGNGEEDVLTAALSAGVPYVALVASPKRGEAVRESLDLAPELRAQLHTPAGLDIGARSPEEIAISILAEVIVVLHTDPAPERPADEVAERPVDEDDRDRDNRERASKKNDNKTRHDATHASADGTSDGHSSGFAPALLADPAESPAAGPQDSSGTGIAIDPVCGMNVAAAESTLHLDVAGSRVYFCGTGCRVAYASQHPDGASQ